MPNPDDNNCCWAYTDGACTNNGYSNARAGVGVFFGSRRNENVSAPFRGRQTNQSAEINAVVIAIRQALKWRCQKITIYTDSKFVIDAAKKWMPKWRRTGWVRNDGKPLLNQRDFQRLDRVMGHIDVVFRKVWAHGRNFGNFMADKLARAGARMDRESYSELDYDTDGDSDFDENPNYNRNMYYSDSSDSDY